MQIYGDKLRPEVRFPYSEKRGMMLANPPFSSPATISEAPSRRAVPIYSPQFVFHLWFGRLFTSCVRREAQPFDNRRRAAAYITFE